jgi:RNA polymerase sigma-70 factor, ECF subfamily
MIFDVLNNLKAGRVNDSFGQLKEMTEAQLLEETVRGDAAAYGEIFTRHRDRAFALAYQYLRDREDAKDIVQDAFIKAYQNLKRFDRGRRFGPWLLTIVRNLSIDQIRKRKHESPDGLPDVLPDRKGKPPDGATLRSEVWSTLKRLSQPHQEILFLRDYQGHTYAEIAEILQIPLGTVMSRLHHARRSLIALLESQNEM